MQEEGPGAACASLAVAARAAAPLITCSGLNISVITAALRVQNAAAAGNSSGSATAVPLLQPGLPTGVRLPVSILWLGRPHTYDAVVAAYLGPRLTQVSPQQVQGAGSLLTVFGSELCPAGICFRNLDAPPDVTVLVGGQRCANVTVISEGALVCRVPGLPRSAPGFPRAAVTVISAAGSASPPSNAAVVSYPLYATAELQALGPLPTEFLPSSPGAEALVTPRIRVRAVAGVWADEPLLDMVCTLTCDVLGATFRSVGATGLTVVSARSSSSAAGVDAPVGTVDFGDVAVHGDFSIPKVRAYVACTSPSVAGTLTLAWDMSALPLRMAVCSRPPLVLLSSEAAPPWRVAVGMLQPQAQALSVPGSSDVAAAGSSSSGNGSASAVLLCGDQRNNASDINAQGNAAVSRVLRSITCNVELLAATDSSASLLGSDGGSGSSNSSGSSSPGGSPVFLDGAAAALDTNGSAIFPRFAVALVGVRAAVARLQVTCRYGTVAVPPVASTALQSSSQLAASESLASFSLTVPGCRPGYAMSGFCAQCGAGTFSEGGPASVCSDCPRTGVRCDGGRLTPLPGYFRPPSQASSPIMATSLLLPCPDSANCLVNASSSSDAGKAGAYSCAAGHTGALCAACDLQQGYARFGQVCAPCDDPALGRFLVALLLIALAGIAAMFATASSAAGKERAPVSIALRITLNYLQVRRYC